MLVVSRAGVEIDRMRLVSSLVLGAMLMASLAMPLKGQGRTASEVADASAHRFDAGKWVSDYLQAFNTGDVQILGAALAHLYSDAYSASFGGNENAAAFRLETFRTMGPLELAPIPPTENPSIIWTRGLISRGWIGHQIEFDAAGAVERHAIWRVRPPSAPATEPVAEENLASEVRSYLDAMAQAGLFSGVVELRRGDQVLVSEAHGRADRNRTPRVTRETPFNIGSVTKLFTAIAALSLVEDGILALDDTVARWIPEYPEPAASRTTLRHLLTHTAGIAYDDDPLYIEEARGARSAEDLLRAQLNSAARVGFQEFGVYKYSSEQIDLVALMMERAMGQPWSELVRDHVLGPTGMTRTSFTPPPGHAVGYTFSARDLDGNVTELQPSSNIFPFHAKPSSHAWSTAQDLARLMRALVAGELLCPELTRGLLEPQVAGEELTQFQLTSWTGLGSQGSDDFGVRTVGHGGVIPGYSAAIEYFPATGHLLTIVSNSGEHSAYIVFQRVLEMIYGVPTRTVVAHSLGEG